VYALGYATAMGVTMLVLTVAAVALLRAGLQREALEF
jgi:hypothetical protein